MLCKSLIGVLTMALVMAAAKDVATGPPALLARVSIKQSLKSPTFYASTWNRSNHLMDRGKRLSMRVPVQDHYYLRWDLGQNSVTLHPLGHTDGLSWIGVKPLGYATKIAGHHTVVSRCFIAARSGIVGPGCLAGKRPAGLPVPSRRCRTASSAGPNRAASKPTATTTSNVMGVTGVRQMANSSKLSCRASQSMCHL